MSICVNNAMLSVSEVNSQVLLWCVTSAERITPQAWLAMTVIITPIRRYPNSPPSEGKKLFYGFACDRFFAQRNPAEQPESGCTAVKAHVSSNETKARFFSVALWFCGSKAPRFWISNFQTQARLNNNYSKNIINRIYSNLQQHLSPDTLQAHLNISKSPPNSFVIVFCKGLNWKSSVSSVDFPLSVS